MQRAGFCMLGPPASVSATRGGEIVAGCDFSIAGKRIARPHKCNGWAYGACYGHLWVQEDINNFSRAQTTRQVLLGGRCLG